MWTLDNLIFDERWFIKLSISVSLTHSLSLFSLSLSLFQCTNFLIWRWIFLVSFRSFHQIAWLASKHAHSKPNVVVGLETELREMKLQLSIERTVLKSHLFRIAHKTIRLIPNKLCYSILIQCAHTSQRTFIIWRVTLFFFYESDNLSKDKSKQKLCRTNHVAFISSSKFSFFLDKTFSSQCDQCFLSIFYAWWQTYSHELSVA